MGSMYDFLNYRVICDPSSLIRWRKIFINRPHVKYPKKTVIVEQGQRPDHLYFIIDGLVEYVYVSEKGEENLIDVLGECSVLCLQPVFGKNVTSGSFIALTDVTLSSISKEEVYNYMDKDSALARELIDEMAKIAGGLIAQLYTHTISAGERVEEIICLLAENRMKYMPEKEKIFIGLSQYVLARLARTTRVTAAKVVSNLKKENLIDTTYGGIVVKDLNGLKKLTAVKKTSIL